MSSRAEGVAASEVPDAPAFARSESVVTARPPSSADSQCVVAVAALAPALNALIKDVTLPFEVARHVLLRIGSEAGLLISAVDGSACVEVWSRASATISVDTTVRIDNLETLRTLLNDESSLARMLLRRKIRLEGDVAWLEQMRGLYTEEAANPRVRRALCTELNAVLAGAPIIGGEASFAASFAPNSSCTAWMPDEAAHACMHCNRIFTFYRRRHHCRTCGRLFCGSCAPNVRDPGCLLVRRQAASQPKRICLDCHGGHISCAYSPDSSNAARPLLGSFASDAAANSQQEHYFAGSDELKKELQELKRDYAMRDEVHLRRDVAQIWLTTQLAVIILVPVLVCWSLVASVTWICFLVVLRKFPRSAFRRNTHVFWAAFSAWVKIRLRKARIRREHLTNDVAEAELLACHRIVARFIFDQISVLGGFWTKFGQQLSVNVGIPVPYQEEFRKLQDQMPPSPIEDILATLREEFGSEVASCIAIETHTPPLGTASIAQVHRATWRAPGAAAPREIVVKVQHRGVEWRFMHDLRAAAVLTRIFTFFDPEGWPDMRPIIDTIRQVTLKELDFQTEAASQTQAAEAVREAGVDVLIPTVIPDLVSRRAMAMTFVDGVQLKHLEQEMPQADHLRLVSALVDHYAVQFCIDGHFHADPHPGNLLVERSTGKLAILDWGMCITLPPSVSRAFARIFYAVATSDLWEMIDSLEATGLHFKDGDVFEPYFFMCIWRFVLQDSQPISSARGEAEKAFVVGDDLYWKGPQRYKKSPVDLFTGDMMYFGKALELLYMVSCQLQVRHPTLQTLFQRAYATLLGRSSSCPTLQTPHCFLPALEPLPRARSALERELTAVLQEFYKQGELLGAQLCVLDIPTGVEDSMGRCPILADIAVGVHGWLELQPVTSSSMFQLLDISKLIVSVGVLGLVDEGRLRLDDALAGHWPGFHDSPSENSAGVTVEHILGHTAGRWGPLPPSIKTMSQLLDAEAMLAAFAEMPPKELPGKEQLYHYMSFGYLCAGVCRYLADCELSDVCEELFAAVAARGGVGIGPQDLALQLTREVSEARDIALIHKPVSSASFEEMAAMIARFGDFVEDPQAHASADPIEGTALEVFGREHLLDLSLFGRSRDVPSALMPGLQAFGTARAVAALLRATAAGSLMSKSLITEMLQSRRPTAEHGGSGGDRLAAQLGHLLNLDAFQEWGLGVQLVRPHVWNDNAGGEIPAWGHLSQSGSMALVLPGRRPRAVALLLNMADGSRTHHVAWTVLGIIAQHGNKSD